MLYDDIIAQKKAFRKSDYSIPAYIIDNLKYPLYEWQKEALENFLINEKVRQNAQDDGEKLKPNHLMFNMATGAGKTLVMAALILYYYKEKNCRNFIFFVNQNAILGKTEDNFLNKLHGKYLYKENIIIDGNIVNIREVNVFSNNTDDIQIKFTTIQKLHNDIYKENESSCLLSDLQKRDLILIGDEAHHLNATTLKKKKNQNTQLSYDISFMGELSEKSTDAAIEASWENTVGYYILNKGGKNSEINNNALLEFTATVPDETEDKYKDKTIMKFDLKDFVRAGCTKHIRLVRTNLNKRERILQALVLNWYRYVIATKHGLPNFKPVILFRNKQIENSKIDYQFFLDLCKNVKRDDFAFLEKNKITVDENSDVSSAYSFDDRIFERINKYLNDNNLTYENIADYIRENFQKRNCIITNSLENTKAKEVTDSETDKLLNSLEDVHNHIRAIFTVQRLTEGWDVLNLYDIVRLDPGRDANFKTGKAGTSTVSEVQLIGRGVRYYPFKYEDKIINRRKFDNDTENELRILEEFYFHSDDDVKYISELSKELKQKGLFEDTRTLKRFNVKPEVQKELNGLYLFVNEKINNPNRRLKKLPEDFANIHFDHQIQTSYSEITKINLDKEKDDYAIVAENEGSTYTISIDNIPLNIRQKAIHKLNTNPNSYYNFENLRKRFDVSSLNQFFEFVSKVKIYLTLPKGTTLEDTDSKELLKMSEKFFIYCQKELEKYDAPFIGTEFKLVKFSDKFSFSENEKNKILFSKEKLINIDKNNIDCKENIRLEDELKVKDWYALDSFWGTSEERNLIEFIKGKIGNLEQNYDKIRLLRNEEVYKIFDFKTGEGFQPDFLLLLHGKENKKNAYYQVFIEPKGKHLTGEDNDGWKNDFLKEITNKYGFSNIFLEENSSYVLIGLPFFNDEDSMLKIEFNNQFDKLE